MITGILVEALWFEQKSKAAEKKELLKGNPVPWLGLKGWGSVIRSQRGGCLVCVTLVCVKVCSFLTSTVVYTCVFPVLISSIWHTCFDLGFSPYLALTLCQVVCIALFFRWLSWFGPCPGKLLILLSDQVFAAPCVFPLDWVLLRNEFLSEDLWDYCLEFLHIVFFDEKRLLLKPIIGKVLCGLCVASASRFCPWQRDSLALKKICACLIIMCCTICYCFVTVSLEVKDSI